MDTTTRKRGSSVAQRRGGPTLRVVFTSGVVRDDWVVPMAPSIVVGRKVGRGGLELAGDPHLSRRHATLTLSASRQTLRVIDESSTGTELDGRPTETGEAEDGSVLRMGDSFLVFRADDDPTDDARVPGIDGLAPSTRRVRSMVELVAPTPATVLLFGETGTGKEVVARALHAASGRRGPFVPVNCSAIPEALAESHFFGHVAGAYTGARTSHEGFFRAAEGGTILLDEIGELPPAVQPKLLRALEDRTVTPVGATRAVPLDVRVVAATNRDLVAAVKEGSFRADLYARLAELVTELGPLRKRREDVLLLMQGALGPGVTMTPDLVSMLVTYEWPFNVRELVKVVSAMRIRARGRSTLDVDVLDDRFRASAAAAVVASDEAAAGGPARPEKPQLERLLRDHQGAVSAVARATGHSRRQVYRWLHKLGIDPARFRDAGDDPG